MSEALAESVVRMLGGYVAVGLVFGLAFVSIGVARIDPDAKGTGIGFRILILPGAIALWPLLLFRWAARRATPPVERNAHRDYVADEGDS